MGRPAGSKNKTKSFIETTKDSVVAELKAKNVGHPLHVTEDWSPSPDMGDIKAPVEGVLSCECLHAKSVHYGPNPEAADWCNSSGCQCQKFKRK